MPEDNYEIRLEDMLINQFEEGRLLTLWNPEDDDKEIVHYDIRNIRNMIKEIDKLYARKKMPTKAEFAKVIHKHRDANATEIGNFLHRLSRDEKIVKVIEKSEDDDEITIRLKKINNIERLKIVESIAKKLSEKMTKKQIQSLLEEGIRCERDVDKLKKVDEDLDDEDVDIKDGKGCFFMEINGRQIGVVR